MQDKKIKILYVHPALSTGGAEELRLLALSNLKLKNNYDLKVCCIENIGEIGEKIKRLGIEVTCLNRSAKLTNISAILSLAAYISKNKFDIVQTSLFNANFHGRIAAILSRAPIVISEEHSEHYQYNSIKFMPYIWSDRILSIFTDKIICCSGNLMDSISRLENIPANKLFLLLNAFNADKLKVTRDSQEMRKALGLGENDLVIANIASLSYRKGQDILIKAFKIVNDKFPNTRLIFIGSEVKEFKQRLLNLMLPLGLSGKVLFLGRQDNVADYLNITDIFVLSSRFEGIPLAMLEAMYMRVPVIATCVGGVSEAIVNNKNGILVEPNDAGPLSAAIIGLLKDRGKRLTLAQEGKNLVLEKFTAERYISRLDNLYNELYAKNNGRPLR